MTSSDRKVVYSSGFVVLWNIVFRVLSAGTEIAESATLVDFLRRGGKREKEK